MVHKNLEGRIAKLEKRYEFLVLPFSEQVLVKKKPKPITIPNWELSREQIARGIARLEDRVRMYRTLRNAHKSHRRKLAAENKRLGAALYDTEKFGLARGNEMIADIEFDDDLGIARPKDK